MRTAFVRSSTVLTALMLTALMLVSARGLVAQRIPADQRTPKLVVLLMVDQFRADYVERYHHQWSRGLQRLVTEGAWFRQAHYPYFNTITCPGHASVSSGTVPAMHGIILNSWWDRAANKAITCTEDDRVTPISYGRPIAGIGDSTARMQVPTLADELRAQRSPAAKVIALSLKARSAIMLGGRKPDAVAWFDDSGSWATSSAFTAAPVPAIADYVTRHPVENDFAKTWDRALPLDAYLFENPPVGLRPTRGGMTPSFPHVVKGPADAPDQMFYDQWQSSPFADEYLAKMALGVAESMGFGKLPGPNMLAISFSTLDKVGHDYGSNSHEIQDILVRLDRTLGDLFAGLDRLVGPGHYTVALTADHGVAPTPERSVALGFDAGRVRLETLLAVAEESLTKTLGAGKHVTSSANNYLYLEPGVYEKLQASPVTMRALLTDLAKVPGVLRAYSRDDLEADRFIGDAMGHQAALSHFPGRSGDVLLAWKPYWIESSNTTTHGSGYQYDTHVPVLLMGTGIAKGEYLALASPTDVAPTLAFLAGVTLPRASGRILIEALSALTGPARPATGNAPLLPARER
jgi:predicted AlkP superfamily pyrophosphatase or phosphodiesterase